MTYTDLTDTLHELSDNTPAKVLLTIAVVLVTQMVIHKLIERVVRRLVTSTRYEKPLDEVKRENTLIAMFRTTSTVVLWLFAVIIIMLELHINISALATGAGLIGIIVGFGAQSTVKDFLAGVFIIAENQYRVDDIVKLQTDGGEVSGMVEDVTIRITRLRDLDGNLHVVPNGSIQLVSNLSFDFANVNIDITVAYDSDLDKVEKVVNEVGKKLSEDEKWGKHIITPIHFFRVENFNDSGISIKALGKVEPAQQWDVASTFRRRLKPAFDKAGVTLPLPQVVVHQAPKKTSK